MSDKYYMASTPLKKVHPTINFNRSTSGCKRVKGTQIIMHTGTHKYDVSLARELKKYLSYTALKHGVIDQGKY